MKIDNCGSPEVAREFVVLMEKLGHEIPKGVPIATGRVFLPDRPAAEENVLAYFDDATDCYRVAYDGLGGAAYGIALDYKELPILRESFRALALSPHGVNKGFAIACPCGTIYGFKHPRLLSSIDRQRTQCTACLARSVGWEGDTAGFDAARRAVASGEWSRALADYALFSQGEYAEPAAFAEWLAARYAIPEGATQAAQHTVYDNVSPSGKGNPAKEYAEDLLFAALDGTPLSPEQIVHSIVPCLPNRTKGRDTRQSFLQKALEALEHEGKVEYKGGLYLVANLWRAKKS